MANLFIHPLSPSFSILSNFQVKKAENELEQKLHEKRDRLKTQLKHEEQKYCDEIDEKYKSQCKMEMMEQCRNLERSRMEREVDRQKYIEIKQIQQQMYDSTFYGQFLFLTNL